MADATLRQHLTASPALYPVAQDLRADAVRLVRLTKSDYEAASFLDTRLLSPELASAWGPWVELHEGAAGLPERCHFIFHISHVGSTLLSRLLGHHPALFSVREPAILRDLADAYFTLDQPDTLWDRAEFGVRLGVYLGLWSRTFEPGQVAVIKATSFVGEMADHLMARVAHSRSILMYVRPRAFLQALLGGAMSDVERLAGQRLSRLHRRLGEAAWRTEDLSAGERVAMSWLSEMVTLRACAARFPTRVLWLDFDDFLAVPESGLVAALTHFGLPDAVEAARLILAGPTMGRYAKAPAYAFDARHRAQLLRQAEQQYHNEIERGTDWLGRAAAAFPVVRDVLDFVAASPNQVKS